MNPLILCAFLAIAGVAVVGAVPNSEWNSFKSQHGKSYSNPIEEQLRKAIFLANKEKVDQFNANEAKEAGYEMGLSHLSDLTEEEMAVRNGFRVPAAAGSFKNSPEGLKFLEEMLNNDDDVPESVDWTQVEGRVSEIKDQGQCGSCWAFSSTGALEGQMVLKSGANGTNGKLISLSEQNLVDCSISNKGCDGGFMLSAWTDISDEGGIEDEKSYPYKASDGDCKFNKKKVVFNDKAGVILTQGDEEALKKTVAKFGPVSIAIDASEISFQLYKKGVYYGKSCGNTEESMNHGVLLVGYGIDKASNSDYWLVKNSWGEKWGDKGLIKMSRNKKNNCGVATLPMIPTF